MIPVVFSEQIWDNLDANIVDSERISSRFADVIKVEIEFKNNNDEKMVINFENVLLVDSKNQEYQNSIYYDLLKKGHNVMEKDCPWGNQLELNPGDLQIASLCFDVPKENVSFILHIYDQDPQFCKEKSNDCQEKSIRVSVKAPEGVSFSDTAIEPLQPLEHSGDIAIALGASISGCEESMECFIPFRFDAGRGSTITWHNVDSDTHTVTSGTPKHGMTENFDSGPIQPGEFYFQKFEKVDVINYFCTIHPWMTGLLNISRSGPVIGNDIPINYEKQKIPSWVKNLASFWCENNIDDDSFVEAIQYLIKNNIILVKEVQKGNNPDSNMIPQWVKNNACWWANGSISEGEMVLALQYLVNERIIKIK